MNYLLLTQKILDVYKKCNICTFPVDCFKVIDTYGMTPIQYSQLTPAKKSSALNVSDDAFTLSKKIYYNDRVCNSRISFSLMHELGHELLGHHGESLADEDEADFFASCILAPRVMIGAYKCQDAEDVHRIFGISYAAANRAWVDYCKCRRYPWSYEDSQILKWFTTPKALPTETHPPVKRTTETRDSKRIKAPSGSSGSGCDLKDYPAAAEYRRRLQRERKEIQKKLAKYEQFAEKYRPVNYLYECGE